MRLDPRDLVRWNSDVRLRFARFLETQPWSVVAENHETSHQSIANVFMHGCNMEDWYLHFIVPGKEWDGPKYDGFTSAAQMRKRVEEVQAKTERFLASLQDKDLDRSVDLGEGRTARLGDVLVECVTEDTHHRGEILAMLWRRDIAPPDVGYLPWAAKAGKA
jgi:uncharacterized damage-inducible protein DinB